MPRLIAIFWLLWAGVSLVRGDERPEFMFCMVMSALMTIAAEIRATR